MNCYKSKKQCTDNERGGGVEVGGGGEDGCGYILDYMLK